MTGASAGLPGLVEALAGHARHSPDRTALVAGSRRLDYGALHDRALRTATALLGHGVRPGRRVAVMGHKTPDAVAALVGVVRTGAAYVPLDPRAPARRCADLVADAGCPVVLVSGSEDPALTAQLAATGATVLTTHEAAAAGADGAGRLPEAIGPDATAYCMYTSGSTGRPKGVQIPHRALDAFFGAVHPLMDVQASDRCLNTSALHFDVSVIDLLYPLVRGATVHLSPSVPMPPLLIGTIERERITHMAAVGSTVTQLADHTAGFRDRDLSSLRRLMTGAEVLSPGSVQRWLAAAPDLTVINGYGPTEATCLVVAHPITAREPERTDPYPIGRPLDGATVRFLRDGGEVDDRGPGEILVAGPQVMSGYLARPEEQRRAFLDVAGVRFYRTGDHGRLRPDGDIAYEGRRDDEVKIRGYRVNVQEVRSVLESHASVGRAFVSPALDRRGRQILTCAITPPGAPAAPAGSRADVGGPLPLLDPEQAHAIRDHLAGRLPTYMVPADFRLLAEVPLLSSGKPDSSGIRRRMTAPAGEESGA